MSARRCILKEPEKSYLHNIPAARRLRGRQTESETILWEALRSRRLNGLKFRRQHAIGRFVVDFYCDDARLVVEIDGGIHLDPDQQVQDRLRQSELEAKNLLFLRVTDRDVTDHLQAVMEKIETTVNSRGLHSTASNPLSRSVGRGGRG